MHWHSLDLYDARNFDKIQGECQNVYRDQLATPSKSYDELDDSKLE